MHLVHFYVVIHTNMNCFLESNMSAITGSESYLQSTISIQQVVITASNDFTIMLLHVLYLPKKCSVSCVLLRTKMIYYTDIKYEWELDYQRLTIKKSLSSSEYLMLQ